MDSIMPHQVALLDLSVEHLADDLRFHVTNTCSFKLWKFCERNAPHGITFIQQISRIYIPRNWLGDPSTALTSFRVI